MKIKINKNSFCNKFLEPISRLVDKCIVYIEKDKIYSIVNNDDSTTIILYGKITVPTNFETDVETLQLNIPDVKRLVRILDNVKEEDVELNINSNNIEYNSNNMRFKYFLLDNNSIKKSLVNVAKIESLTFDTDFIVNQKAFNDVIKNNSLTPNSDKLYFYSENNNIYGSLTDLNTPNLDSITLLLSENYTGLNISPVPIKLEVFRVIGGSRFDKIVIKYNTKLKVFMFEVRDNNLMLNYVISSLTK